MADLIAERKAVRAEIGPANDEATNIALDHKQNAIKVSSNSVYGATGSQHGVLPPASYVAETVTSEGRRMIEVVRSMVERYGIAGGERMVLLSDDASGTAAATPLRVIYGDTDSVFILFETASPQLAERSGQILAAECTRRFPRPIKLEYEKMSQRSLFKQTKKRYALNMYELGDALDDPCGGKIKVRGMSMVRRDNFAFKRNLEKRMVDILLDLRRDPKQAIKDCEAHVRSELRRLVSGNVSLHELTVNVSLTKPLEAYSDDVVIPKVVAARFVLAPPPPSHPERSGRVSCMTVCVARARVCVCVCGGGADAWCARIRWCASRRATASTSLWGVFRARLLAARSPILPWTSRRSSDGTTCSI